MKIEVMHLSGIFSKNSPLNLSAFVDSLNDTLPIYSIDTKDRIAAFLAQTAHETGNFKWLTELGGKSYFSKYEPGTNIGRKLGNRYVGDGYKFRGRGLIQLTGRYNYTKFRDHLTNKKGVPTTDVIAHPDEVSELPLAIVAACWYWDNRSLNKYADNRDFSTLTKRINGGLNGYRDRLQKYKALLAKL